MTNPFESADAEYVVLINHEDQHSLWPVFADVPAGWATAFGPDTRAECLQFVERNWTDITPTSARQEEQP